MAFPDSQPYSWFLHLINNVEDIVVSRGLKATCAVPLKCLFGCIKPGWVFGLPVPHIPAHGLKGSGSFPSEFLN